MLFSHVITRHCYFLHPEKKKKKKKKAGTSSVKLSYHAGHARLRKYLFLNNFLSFYSVRLKLGNKKNSSFSKILCFLFLRSLYFWRENDITNFVPKFGFANMGYLKILFERTFLKDLKTEKKKSEISLSTQKIKFRNLSFPPFCY